MLANTKYTTLLLAASAASAQSFNFSATCTSAVKGLLSSPEAACLNPGALLSFFIGSNPSVPQTVSKWLTGMCAQGTCSDESLTAVVTNVTTGCSEDLAGIGFSVSQDDIASTIMPLVQKVYPVAREVSCLKNDTTNQLCAVQTITDLESIVGTLSSSDFSFLNLMDDVEQLLAAGADDLACTGCVQEAFSIARDAFPDIVANADSTVSGVCGQDFLAGSSASEGVSQTAVDGVFAATSQNDTNGASAWHAGPILAPVSIVAYFLL